MTDSQVSRPLLCGLSSQMFPSLALAALMAISALGCNKESKFDRKPIFGDIVGADGRDGIVTFMPTDTSKGTAAILNFENGAYKFSEVDGPVPGNYSVSIKFETSELSARARGRGGRNASDGGRKAYGPAKTTTVSVSADGPIKIDLDPN